MLFAPKSVTGSVGVLPDNDVARSLILRPQMLYDSLDEFLAVLTDGIFQNAGAALDLKLSKIILPLVRPSYRYHTLACFRLHYDLMMLLFLAICINNRKIQDQFTWPFFYLDFS